MRRRRPNLSNRPEPKAQNLRAKARLEFSIRITKDIKRRIIWRSKGL